LPKVYINQGHGGLDPGAVDPQGREEDDSNFICGSILKDLLLDDGYEVLVARTGDYEVKMAEAVSTARSWGADVFLDIHADWTGNSAVYGPHIIKSIHAFPNTYEDILARLILEYICKATERPSSRGIWSKESTTNPGKDYYYTLRETAMPALIIERGFLSNPEEADLLFNLEYLRKQAKGIKAGLDTFFALSWTAVIGTPQVTLEQARQWAQKRGAHQRFIDVADLYWYWSILYGIRPEIAYCQAAKETNFGKFTGIVQPHMHNWCGLKTADASGDRVEDHASFPDDSTGVHAHIQHIGVYIGLSPLSPLVDPRYERVKSAEWANRLKYIEEFGSRWAPDPNYGRSIVSHYLIDLLNTVIVPPGPSYEELVEKLEEMKMENERLSVELTELVGFMSAGLDDIEKTTKAIKELLEV
jgi:N-acetylmuramoyl-L-alanine amidase